MAYANLAEPSAKPGAQKLLSRAVADWIAQRIITGVERPGSRLTEVKLAKLAGVSRSPVREALRLLEREGLIEIVPRLGAQVVDVGADDARDLYACRLALEPEATRLAVCRMTNEVVTELESKSRAMHAAVGADDARAYLTENIGYFAALIRPCPNPILRELVEQTWNKAARYWSIFARLPGYAAHSVALHAELHNAVVAREAERAALANRQILEFALDALVDALGKAALDTTDVAT